ncbi:uncharacterized protein Tco025E_08072 [Trypanosoma conorhini]|uniref:Uncharacterized protein n=1 Tax=Trypanosoma conorhini TaxID=83891 RepID=A0A3R7MK16_9TRYP|nr:uncharacterized protein Tco025E_08072 [Trypanosoma conorhini]RNF03934.1 hypothetical protein Tco025E_08072 [Trypanosoma conorhini]
MELLTVTTTIIIIFPLGVLVVLRCGGADDAGLVCLLLLLFLCVRGGFGAAAVSVVGDLLARFPIAPLFSTPCLLLFVSLPLLSSPFATGTNLRSTRDGLHGECGHARSLFLLHRAHSLAHHFPFHFRSLTGTWTPRLCRSWGAEADERCRTFVCFPRDMSGVRPCTVRWEGGGGETVWAAPTQREGRGDVASWASAFGRVSFGG